MSDQKQEYRISRIALVRGFSILSLLQDAGAPIDGVFSLEVREGYVVEFYEDREKNELVYIFKKVKS